jgi:uncharacterized membrane protein
MEPELETLVAQEGGNEHTIYELFKWSLLLKGTVSVGEVIAGIALLFVPWPVVASFVDWLRTHASSGADNVIMAHLLKELANFTQATVVFVALYFLIRGSVKIALIWQLLHNRRWAYPASLVVMGLFVMYQIYQLITGGSLLVVLLTLFDVIVLGLIWHEWSIVRRYDESKGG